MHVVMLSGGLDSAVLLADVVENVGSENVKAIWVNYGQAQVNGERRAVDEITKWYGVKLEKIAILPGLTLGEPKFWEIKDKAYDEVDVVKAKFYVPARNALFLALGASRAWPEGIVYLAAHEPDTPYPDQDAGLYEVSRKLIQISTYGKVDVKMPWIKMRKEDIIKRGVELNVPMHLTWSCYMDGDVHCGRCASCIARRQAFERAGVKDVTKYDVDDREVDET